MIVYQKQTDEPSQTKETNKNPLYTPAKPIRIAYPITPNDKKLPSFHQILLFPSSSRRLFFSTTPPAFIYPNPYHAVASPAPTRLVVSEDVDALVCHIYLVYTLSGSQNHCKLSVDFLYLSFSEVLHTPLGLVGGETGLRDSFWRSISRRQVFLSLSL